MEKSDEEAQRRHDNIVLALACVGQFMVVLDVSVVNVALPSIGRQLHFTPSGLQWVVNAYVLAFAGFLLLGGRAADLFGRRRLFLLGTALFTAASLVGGIATTSGMLTGARVVQGLGGALLSPATLTIIISTFRGPRLPKALAAWGAVGGAGGATGALLGGVLTAELSWRWIFFINIPIGLAVFALAIGSISELKHRQEGEKLDLVGALLVTSGLGSLVYGIVGTSQHPWGSTTTLSWLLGAAVLLGFFLLWEARLASDPLVPLSFFANRGSNSTNFIMLLMGAAFFSMWYFLTLYFQEVLGWSALRSGLAFAPMAGAIILFSQIAPRLLQRVGAWVVILLGTGVTAIGFFALSHLDASSTYLSLVLPASLAISSGLGLLFGPLAAAATSGVAPDKAGLASGMLNSSRQIGGSLGLAVLATVAVSATSSRLGYHPTFGGATQPDVASALIHGYATAFFVGTFITGTAFVATLLLLPRDIAQHVRQAPVPRGE